MGHYISSSNNDHSCIRSLILFDPNFYVSGREWKWLSKDFKLVRVLEVGLISCEKIPSNLGNFINLRYLRIKSTCQFTFVPSSILNLWSLQTIDLRDYSYVTPTSFPVQMWKLKYLRHLNTHGFIKLRGSCFGTDEKMWNLQTISGILLNKQATSLIKKGTFPNLKRIWFVLASEYKGELPKLLQSLQQSSHLNKLDIVLYNKFDEGWKPQELLQGIGQFNCLTFLKIHTVRDLLTYVFAFPPNLTVLKLSEINCISDEGMNGLGNLTKLKFLRLSGNYSYDGDSFDLNCVGDTFPQLEVFEMENLKLGKWKLGNGAMRRLQDVIIFSCKRLDDLPNELWSLSALRKVKVMRSSKQMDSRLRNLETNNEVQLVLQ